MLFSKQLTYALFLILSKYFWKGWLNGGKIYSWACLLTLIKLVHICVSLYKGFHKDGVDILYFDVCAWKREH